MRKEKILVQDNKKNFLKMFKRKFNEKFEFTEVCFLSENAVETKDFNRSIIVIYDKFELSNFFKFNIKSSNIMICLFNKKLHDSLYYFAETNKITVIDASRTKMELYNDLDLYFSSKYDLVDEREKVFSFK